MTDFIFYIFLETVSGKKQLTTARSSESASAFEDVTSKFKPTAAAVRSKGPSISFVGVG